MCRKLHNKLQQKKLREREREWNYYGTSGNQEYKVREVEFQIPRLPLEYIVMYHMQSFGNLKMRGNKHIPIYLFCCLLSLRLLMLEKSQKNKTLNYRDKKKCSNT